MLSSATLNVTGDLKPTEIDNKEPLFRTFSNIMAEMLHHLHNYISISI